MIRSHPTSTLFPYTTLFRSTLVANSAGPSETWGVPFARGPILPRPRLGDPRREFATSVNIRVTKPGSDRKSTRLNSSHGYISYAVFCLKKKIYHFGKYFQRC